MTQICMIYADKIIFNHKDSRYLYSIKNKKNDYR